MTHDARSKKKNASAFSVSLSVVPHEIGKSPPPVHDCMDKTMVNATGGVGIFATGVSVVAEFDDIWATTP
jgi:hypothetical protein